MDAYRHLTGCLLALLLTGMLAGCSSEDTPTGPEPEPETNLPAVPTPGSTGELLPAKSDDLIIGMSDPLDDFAPLANRLRIMLDDGTLTWYDVFRRVLLACGGALAENTSDPAALDPTYLGAPPRLLHQRYWRKLKQVTLDPGTTYEQEETISYGTSVSHEQSREFSRTMGIELEAGGGWGPFSASVTTSYEQTETGSEVHAVTFSEESSFTETFTVQSDPDRTIVYALWQLVDKFSFVDADTVRIHDSSSLLHVEMPEIADIEFPNRDVIYQSVTRFD